MSLQDSLPALNLINVEIVKTEIEEKLLYSCRSEIRITWILSLLHKLSIPRIPFYFSIKGFKKELIIMKEKLISRWMESLFVS